jgi:hypothetical protein
MKEILLIGNKLYNNLNIDIVLDNFEHNYRFNFSIPNNNNGTKYDKIILNNHVFINVMNHNIGYIKNKYCTTFNISENYLEKFYNSLEKYNQIESQSNQWRRFNNFLIKNKCPFQFTHLPRIGYIKMMELILENKKLILFGWSIKDFFYEKHLYNKNIFYGDLKKNNIERTGHNHAVEEKILLWLHNNHYIDATLCLLKDEKELSFINSDFIRTNYILKLLQENNLITS